MTMSKLIEKNKVRAMLKEKKKKNDVHYLPQGFIPMVLVLTFIASDYIFISQLLEHYFNEAQWRGVVASIIIAIIIDVSPTIIAACLMTKSKQKIHYIGVVALTVVEFALFALLGYVRVNSADLIFSIKSTSLKSATSAAKETALTSGQTGMSWLFVALPIATSILSFIIGIMTDGNSENRINDKIWVTKLYDEMAQDEADRIELQHVIDSDLEGDSDKKLELTIKDVEAYKKITYDRMSILQAIASGNPQAASEIFARDAS